jgi:pimeloyl-ACP methyl ester carboxylesterase
MRRSLAPLLITALAAAAVACAEPPPPDTGPSCTQHTIAVSIERGEPAGHDVATWLCARGPVTADTPVQVLLHGGTYDHAYWDWPYQPATYSYVHAATARGFATLNVDRLGHGRSDRPDARLLDSAAHGWIVHQLVRVLRDGRIGPSFRTVVLNGHSMGGIAAEHAAGFGDVDALIVSGIPADAGAGEPSESEPEADGSDDRLPFWPVEQDPGFAGRDWPPGYLTTRPGSRPALFLHEGDHDPAIAEQEEARKDTVSAAELAGVGGEGGPAPGPTDAPVLHVLGRYDALICRATRDCRSDPAAAQTPDIVERSGHSLNLGHGAGEFYELTFSWLASHGIGSPHTDRSSGST